MSSVAASRLQGQTLASNVSDLVVGVQVRLGKEARTSQIAEMFERET